MYKLSIYIYLKTTSRRIFQNVLICRRAPHCLKSAYSYCERSILYENNKYEHIWKFIFWKGCSFLASWAAPFRLQAGSKKGTPLTRIMSACYTYTPTLDENLHIVAKTLCSLSLPSQLVNLSATKKINENTFF